MKWGDGMRLIDKKPLIRQLVNWQMEQFSEVGHEREFNLLDMIIRGIENEPTIEAVPVVQAESIRKEAVEDFAKWCYINGIDFSYMHKATDTEPFCKRVLKRYEEEQGKKV